MDKISVQEAKAWIALAKARKATAKELSEKSGVARRTVGLCLKTWREKKIAIALPTFPPTYSVSLAVLKRHPYIRALDAACNAYGLFSGPR